MVDLVTSLVFGNSRKGCPRLQLLWSSETAAISKPFCILELDPLMQVLEQSPVSKVSTPLPTLAVAATFTAEPIEDTLAFWMQELGLPFAVEFAPYNQVFQQLLDPGSLFAQNAIGINLILLRLEDWRRAGESPQAQADAVARNAQDFVTMLKAATGRTATPYLFCLCPDAPDLALDAEWQTVRQQWTPFILDALTGQSGLHVIQPQDFEGYPVADYYDPQRDKLGHIPFTPSYFAALATVVARRIYSIKSAPHKVIVLDCDNTIWKGIVGEDGVMGIEIPPAWHQLQEFMVAQQQAGMLLCLNSKNNEPDVMEAFAQRTDMPMTLEHIVAWRINWMPKSENIKSLAAELNLGLDSFIFIDDNPVECAEVQANCPDVLTLQLPVDGDIPQFLRHVWALDHFQVTAEDQQRTALYKQNLERDRFQQETTTLDDFLAGLNLQITISQPTETQLPRVAQLTQRTNQFNFSTVRRTEAEVQQLAQAGLDCRIVEVSDRFGDYGLVGVIIFGPSGSALQVDTFLLSCRVLGRGVEHRMVSYLGELAQQQGLDTVQMPFRRSKKNLPALNFLERVAAQGQQTTADGFQFVLPTDTAARLVYAPVAEPAPQTGESTPTEAGVESSAPKPVSPAPTADPQASISKSQRLGRIAIELDTPDRIVAQVQSRQRMPRPDLAQTYVTPRTVTECHLADLWAALLNLEKVGLHDNYFDLGGTSLQSVELFAQIQTQFGKKLPLTTLIEAPTIAKLAEKITQSGTANSLVLLREGGDKPAVFLIHDGFGETMLYRNLATRLHPGHPVYGLQPKSEANCPIGHTRIVDMAAHYVAKIKSVQPQGPYLVGGMCAGGVLAFEVAQQLQALGDAVPLVAIMDVADVETPRRAGLASSRRLERFSGILTEDSTHSGLQRALGIATKARQKLTNYVVYETQVKWQRLHNQLKLSLLRFYLDRGQPLPTFLQNISVDLVYTFAEQGYAPKGRFQGDVVLLRATDNSGNDEPHANFYDDPLMGWEKRVSGAVAAYDVPGGHATMLQEPHVQAMVAVLQPYLDQLEA
jgi:FkbH-like protein